MLLAISLLTITFLPSCDKDDNGLTKPEDLVNTTWDCNEPPVGFEDEWDDDGLKALRFVFRSTTKAEYWIIGENYTENEGTMTYEISNKNITLTPDDSDFDDLKWIGSISGNQMNMTIKGSHIPNGEIGPFVFVKQ